MRLHSRSPAAAAAPELPGGDAGRPLLAGERGWPGMQVCLLVLVLAALVLATFPYLGKPYLVGHDGFNGAFLSISAVNTLRFGLVATRAGPAREYWGDTPPAEPHFYTSHPYGFPLIVTGAFALFGLSELVGRSLSLAFSLGLVAMLFLFGRHLRLGGLVAAAVAASLPVMHEFGPALVGQIPSLPFVVALYLFYFRLLRQSQLSAATAAGFVLSLLGAGLLDWHVFCHAPFLALHLAWTSRHEPRRLARLLLLLTVAAGIPLGAFLLHTYWLGGFPYLLAKIGERTGFAPAVTFDWPEFFSRQGHYLYLMFRPATVFLALAGLLLPAPDRAGDLQRAARLSAAAAVLETLALNEAVYIHIYFSFVWILPVCFGLGALAESLADAVGPRLCAAVAAALLAGLFVSSLHQLSQGAELRAKRSLPLIQVAQDLSRRLAKGEKVALHLKPIQFVPQLKYYLRHEFLYTREAGEARTIAERCPECRFLVVAAGRQGAPDAGPLVDELLGRFPHELVHGYHIFTLPGSRPGGVRS